MPQDNNNNNNQSNVNNPYGAGFNGQPPSNAYGGGAAGGIQGYGAP